MMEKPDLIWKNDTIDIVAIWLMNGVDMIRIGSPGIVPAEWAIQHYGYNLKQVFLL